MHILFFGDSICVGQGVSIYKGWVTKLARYFDTYGRKTNINFLVTNSSVNGRTTRQALEDMPYHIQAQEIDILVVQFGLNDCNFWVTDGGLSRVSLGAYEENLKEITVRALNSGVKRVVLNSNHPTTRHVILPSGVDCGYEENNKKYCETVKKVADQFGDEVIFVDVYKYFEALKVEAFLSDDHLLEDGLHLSPKGHDLYFTLMRPVIERLVKECCVEVKGQK